MTKMSAEQTLGNSAVAYVAWRLASAGCIVRHVFEGTDVGIDLFCESTTARESPIARPFLHFFVQVKGGAQCTKLADGAVSCKFGRDHIEYWDRQPAPVFVALVPEVTDDSPIFMVDVMGDWKGPHRAFGKKKSVRLRSSFELAGGDRRGVERFLSEVVPRATALLERSVGMVAPDPSPARGYVRTFHALHTAKIAPWSSRIAYQLRTTTAMSVLIAWRTGELAGRAFRETRELLVDLLQGWASFELKEGQKRHWEVFFAGALLFHVNGDHRTATTHYRIAVDTIADDQKLWPLTLEWERDHIDVSTCLHAANEGRVLPPPTA